MSLRPLYGHAALRHRLTAAAAEDRLPASLMLQGRRGVGKQRLGLWLGQYLLCERALSERLLEPCGDCQHCRYTGRGIHPDLHWFFPRPRLKDGDASPDDVKADYSEAIAERMEAEGLGFADVLADAQALLQHSGEQLAKQRYGLDLPGGDWVLDVFVGANAPLVIAEVELATADQSVAVPPWCVQELTGLGGFSNAALARSPFASWPPQEREPL